MKFDNMYNLRFILAISLLFAFSAVLSQKLSSGLALKMAGDAPFATPGVSTFPIGAAYVFSEKNQDIFMTADYRYSGMYLYRWLRNNSSGVPVFSDGLKLNLPREFKNVTNVSIVQEQSSSEILAFWLIKDTVVETSFRKEQLRFEIVHKYKVQGLPRNARTISVGRNADASMSIYFEVSDGVPGNGPVHWRDKVFPPHTAEGMWVGNLSYSGIYHGRVRPAEGIIEAKMATPDLRQGLFSLQKISHIKIAASDEGIISGSHLGNMFFYKTGQEDSDKGLLSPKRFLVDEKGVIIRHPSILARPITYYDESSRPNIIVGGEGMLYHYAFESVDGSGNLVYKQPHLVLQQNPYMKSGTLAIPNIVDWDGDGVQDIVTGTSEGYVMFYKNRGTDAEPVFASVEYLKANDKIIHVQAGYRGSIQGPGEARWGYMNPTIVDWNEDGLPDILSNDINAEHQVFLNVGTRTQPRLSESRPLYLDGLNMRGTWRTKPASAKMGKDMVYITLDDKDEFHLYRKIDNQNLLDGGKILLANGQKIIANYFKGGGSGRAKFVLTDWDGDGILDVLVGTNRHAVIPDLESGLPHKKDRLGAAVLFMKNIGSNDNMVLDFPKIIRHKGKDMRFGEHSCSPAVGALGGGTQNLIVGTEEGKIYFFKKSELSW